MYNLFKILAIGIIVIKARISFQLVITMPLCQHAGVPRRGHQWVHGLHSVHITIWAAAYMELHQENYFSED